MEQKVGKTGLSQKEAIYQIICSVLGAKLRPGVEVESIISQKAPGDIRPRWNSPELQQMIELVHLGIEDGTVPSKYNSGSDGRKVREYANRITHYWLRNDRRLNGGFSGTRISKRKQREFVLKSRLKHDPQLVALQAVYERCSDSDKFEVETYRMGRMFSIILEEFGVNAEEIPLSLRKLVKIECDPPATIPNKKVA